MVLESVKYDSLKVAYKKQTKLLDFVTTQNIEIYKKFEVVTQAKKILIHRVKRFEEQSEKNNKKQSKPFGVSIYAGYGMNEKGLSPQIGIGISYSIFRF